MKGSVPVIQADFWENYYNASAPLPWDLGGPSPHFKALLAQPPAYLRPGKMAVPGSGRGHDAALFAQHGFEVTAFDYTRGALESAKQLYRDMFETIQGDWLILDTQPSWQKQFDYILEHTCFCAISPLDRPRYAQTAATLLKPEGLLIGVFWEHDNPDGPPFSTTENDIREIFAENFHVLSLVEKNPASGRSGVERLVILQRRSNGRHLS